MRFRQMFIVWLLALTFLSTQSHIIHKRGLISRIFGRNSKTTNNDDVEDKLPSKERSRFRDLLKNPIVITILSAAVGMIVQKALAANSMDDVCENKYVKMAHSIGNLNWEMQQIINLLGCNQRYSKQQQQQISSTLSPDDGEFTTRSRRKGVTTTTTTMSMNLSDDENEEPNENEEALESSLTPEKESKIRELLDIAQRKKGSKRQFLKNLFGLNKKNKAFKQGHKLPSSSYKLDKDDAKALEALEKDIEQYNQLHP